MITNTIQTNQYVSCSCNSFNLIYQKGVIFTQTYTELEILYFLRFILELFSLVIYWKLYFNYSIIIFHRYRFICLCAVHITIFDIPYWITIDDIDTLFILREVKEKIQISRSNVWINELYFSFKFEPYIHCIMWLFHVKLLKT